jgi:spore germination cell wall hydrolase CwlJ-like protein
VSERQVQLLASTIFAEARSEGARGMRAVAHVINNRAQAGNRFGNGMAGVILKPWQFSAWNKGDPNRKIALNPQKYARSGNDRAAWADAQTIAREVVEGRSVDPTNGALFYHTRAVKPRWSSSGVGKRVIGRHIFYRDVRG